jgi:hypothetical protein
MTISMTVQIDNSTQNWAECECLQGRVIMEKEERDSTRLNLGGVELGPNVLKMPLVESSSGQDDKLVN